MTDILSIIVFGAIVGWLTGKLLRGRGYGLVGDVIIGVMGAVFGGAIFHLLGLAAYGLVGSIIMSVIGAACLLTLLSLGRGRPYGT